MKNKLIGIVAGLAISGAAAIGVNSYLNRDSEFSVRGELMDDYVYNTPIGRFYRIEIKTSDGKEIGYPVLCDQEELLKIDEKYKSRKESGKDGDYIGVDPKTNVFSLDEVVILPDNIKILEKKD